MDKPTQHQHEHEHHIVPFGVYYRVFGALIIGTVLTVATSYMDFGSMNILIAMAIATAKALLVILFFMGLKYEGQENNVTFFCSFVFLAIFVSLTSADVFYRSPLEPVKVDASETPQSTEPVDVKKLIQPNPEALAKGKALFSQQCVTCHGAEGKGDGPAAAALNPKPRNFTLDAGWKKGRSVTEVFKTITQGLPGTPMPPFSALSADERFALTHYVQALGPKAPEATAEMVASLEKELGGGPSKPRISVSRAMEKMAQEWEAAHGK